MIASLLGAPLLFPGLLVDLITCGLISGVKQDEYLALRYEVESCDIFVKLETVLEIEEGGQISEFVLF